VKNATEGGRALVGKECLNRKKEREAVGGKRGQKVQWDRMDFRTWTITLEWKGEEKKARVEKRRTWLHDYLSQEKTGNREPLRRGSGILQELLREKEREGLGSRGENQRRSLACLGPKRRGDTGLGGRGGGAVGIWWGCSPKSF